MKLHRVQKSSPSAGGVKVGPKRAASAVTMAVTTLLLAGVVAVPPALGDASESRWAVVNTESGLPLRYRTAPHTGPGSVVKGLLQDGARVQISCFVRGETISGTYGKSNLWNKTTRSGYYMPDAYLYTGSDNPVVPPCEGPKSKPSPPGSYATPRNNPHPPANSRAPKATARTQFVADEIARLTGERQCWVGAYRPAPAKPTSNHNTGNALDCMISSKIGSRPSKAQYEQGWQLAKWLRKHAELLDVRYVMWDGKIWSVARSKEGWRNHHAKGITAGHLDHVHVSIQNPGNRD